VWYPVHGLGDGFEYATATWRCKPPAARRLEVRLLATGNFRVDCVLAVRAAPWCSSNSISHRWRRPCSVSRRGRQPQEPIEVTVTNNAPRAGAFTTRCRSHGQPADPATLSRSRMIN